MHQCIEDAPCLLGTKDILSSNPFHVCEQFLNLVKRHTKCTRNLCLHRNGTTLECRYKFHWNVQHESSLYIDEKGQQKYHSTRNDAQLDIIFLAYFKHGEQMWIAN